MRTAAGLAAACLLALASSCSEAAPSATSATAAEPAAAKTSGPPWFEEVALASGVDFRHVRALEQRFWFPEIMGSGLAWLDFDGDQKLDLFCVQSGDLAPPPGQQGPRVQVPGDRLFRNRGDGTFEDATSRAGLREAAYGMGCAVGDYDGDGDVDLFVTNFGPDALWRNEGNGTFADVTAEAGVAHDGWGASAGFFDFDGDLDLDLFVVNYVRWSKDTEIECTSTYGERDYCAPGNYNAPAQSVLWRNEGNGRFGDVSREAGLLAAFGNGLGLALCDFDRDGKLDAYVSNDGNPNQLWINQGDGRFVDKAVVSGAAVNRNGAAEASMGTVPCDVDDNGFVDLFITNLRGESNTFYFNDRGVFTDRTPHTGLALASLPYTGFGDGLFDFDLDGTLDLYVVNGRVGTWRPAHSPTDPFAEPSQLFRGIGGGRFEELSPAGGTHEPLVDTSRGAAFGDYDDDGDVDVAVSTNHGPLRLLRNVAPRAGNWIGMRVLDERGGDAVGASVALRALGRTMHREVAPCSSYCSSNDPRVHFGIGSAAEGADVAVKWPGGSREGFGTLSAGRYHVLRRGAGETR